MQTTGNTILITGGNAGIGLALAKAFAQKDNKVIICGRNEAELQDLQREIPNVVAKRCDLTVQADRDELIRWTLERFPDLNMVINNAGVLAETDLLSDTFDFESVQEQLTTDLYAPIELSLRFLPRLRQQSNAALVNVSSGLVYSPAASAPIYAAAKAGIHAFTQAARYQLRDTDVKVVEVLPPTVDTNLNKDLDLEAAGGAISPEEAAEAILKGLADDTTEIRIGQVKWLYLGSRIAPGFVNRKLNEQVDKARHSADEKRKPRVSSLMSLADFLGVNTSVRISDCRQTIVAPASICILFY